MIINWVWLSVYLYSQSWLNIQEFQCYLYIVKMFFTTCSIMKRKHFELIVHLQNIKNIQLHYGVWRIFFQCVLMMLPYFKYLEIDICHWGLLGILDIENKEYGIYSSSTKTWLKRSLNSNMFIIQFITFIEFILPRLRKDWS